MEAMGTLTKEHLRMWVMDRTFPLTLALSPQGRGGATPKGRRNVG